MIAEKDIAGARSMGATRANEWIARPPGAESPPLLLAAWRARCFADTVHEYESRPDFLNMLSAWESAFDETIAAGGRDAACAQPSAVPWEFNPFSWLDADLKNDQFGAFAARTLDVCQGISICLELAYSSDQEREFNLDADPGDKSTPYLSAADASRLYFFAKSAAELLADKAEVNIDRLNDRALSARLAKGGRRG